MSTRRSPGFYFTKIAILTAALRQWICPACGGSGKYQDKGFRGSKDRKIFVINNVTCKKCGGNGQHPIATEALKRAEEVVDE